MKLNPSAFEDSNFEGLSVSDMVSTLIDRVNPDLITVTGDIANGYGECEDGDPNNSVYRKCTDMMDSFRIPWAPANGNHDHVNNSVVNYNGLCLIYGLKTGKTTYYEDSLNGGTVLTVGSDGIIKDVRHEYVN